MPANGSFLNGLKFTSLALLAPLHVALATTLPVAPVSLEAGIVRASASLDLIDDDTSKTRDFTVMACLKDLIYKTAFRSGLRLPYSQQPLAPAMARIDAADGWPCSDDSFTCASIEEPSYEAVSQVRVSPRSGDGYIFVLNTRQGRFQGWIRADVTSGVVRSNSVFQRMENNGSNVSGVEADCSFDANSGSPVQAVNFQLQNASGQAVLRVGSGF
jgi:hypothetical protein